MGKHSARMGDKAQFCLGCRPKRRRRGNQVAHPACLLPPDRWGAVTRGWIRTSIIQKARRTPRNLIVSYHATPRHSLLAILPRQPIFSTMKQPKKRRRLSKLWNGLCVRAGEGLAADAVCENPQHHPDRRDEKQNAQRVLRRHLHNHSHADIQHQPAHGKKRWCHASCRRREKQRDE